jgi:hypothetical protein
LLEIGLWRRLESFDSDQIEDEDDFQEALLDSTNDLVGQVGAEYASAVRECLSITSPQAMSWNEAKDIATLEQCLA